MFQSPRSGKFESNWSSMLRTGPMRVSCFNPLDRGNLNQMYPYSGTSFYGKAKFQSPRSGKFESNVEVNPPTVGQLSFQSPRSGKFESNS